VPFVENLGTGATGASYRWARTDGEPETFFDDIKATAFPEELARAVRVCLFAHQISHLTDSGISRGIPTSYFIVTLGAFVDLSKPAPRKPPVDLQRGTFMHEVGHGLGLRHGGANETNFKPNYLSVMSYAFQGGLRKRGSPTFDYSRTTLPELTETSLNEELGIEDWPTSVAGFQTTWFRGFGGGSQQWTAPFMPGAESNVDWDQDGNDSEIGVSSSINRDLSRSVLSGHDDWRNLVFTGGTIGAGIGIELPETTALDGELDVATALTLVPPPVEGLAARSGRGSVRLNWNPAGFRGDVTYSIFRKIAGAAGDPALLATTTSTLYSDRTVVRRTTYEYTVSFVDALDAESAMSEPVTVRVR